MIFSTGLERRLPNPIHRNVFGFYIFLFFFGPSVYDRCCHRPRLIWLLSIIICRLTISKDAFCRPISSNICHLRTSAECGVSPEVIRGIIVYLLFPPVRKFFYQSVPRAWPNRSNRWPWKISDLYDSVEPNFHSSSSRLFFSRVFFFEYFTVMVV